MTWQDRYETVRRIGSLRHFADAGGACDYCGGMAMIGGVPCPQCGGSGHSGDGGNVWTPDARGDGDFHGDQYDTSWNDDIQGLGSRKTAAGTCPNCQYSNIESGAGRCPACNYQLRWDIMNLDGDPVEAYDDGKVLAARKIARDELAEAIQTAQNAIEIDKRLVREDARSGYIIIKVPAIGPNGGHYDEGYRVYSDQPQAPGGILPPGQLPPGDIVAHVDKDGHVRHTASNADVGTEMSNGTSEPGAHEIPAGGSSGSGNIYDVSNYPTYDRTYVVTQPNPASKSAAGPPHTDTICPGSGKVDGGDSHCPVCDQYAPDGWQTAGGFVRKWHSLPEDQMDKLSGLREDAENQGHMTGQACRGCGLPANKSDGKVTQRDLGSQDKWHHECYQMYNRRLKKDPNTDKFHGSLHTTAAAGAVVRKGKGKTGYSVHCDACGHQPMSGLTYDGAHNMADTHNSLTHSKQAAYNPFSDPQSAYNNPDKGPHKGTPDSLFPDGVPLHGDLSDEQQAWLDKRGHTASSFAEEQAARLKAEKDAPFKRTHTYNPIGWDQFDAKGVVGNPIKAGSDVELLKEHNRSLHSGMPSSAKEMFNVIRDADGNMQHVHKNSLDRKKTAARRTAAWVVFDTATNTVLDGPYDEKDEATLALSRASQGSAGFLAESLVVQEAPENDAGYRAGVGVSPWS